jgi:hypothetical protein
MESALRERLAPEVLHHQLGHDHRRYLTFVRDGINLRGSANLAAPGRKEAGGTATNAEAIQLFRSYSAYSAITVTGANCPFYSPQIAAYLTLMLAPFGIADKPQPSPPASNGAGASLCHVACRKMSSLRAMRDAFLPWTAAGSRPCGAFQSPG